jgi:hypothetical protein
MTLFANLGQQWRGAGRKMILLLQDTHEVGGTGVSM